ncbi:MAG: hypothetical protein N2558_04810 [Patescibacteria group bacterium]|nr:hypothetical protein [Patescibacteria group bacterium]
MSLIEKNLKHKSKTFIREIVEDLLNFESSGFLQKDSNADKFLLDIFGKEYEKNRVAYLNILAKETFKFITKQYYNIN